MKSFASLSKVTKRRSHRCVSLAYTPAWMTSSFPFLVPMAERDPGAFEGSFSKASLGSSHERQEHLRQRVVVPIHLVGRLPREHVQEAVDQGDLMLDSLLPMDATQRTIDRFEGVARQEVPGSILTEGLEIGDPLWIIQQPPQLTGNELLIQP